MVAEVAREVVNSASMKTPFSRRRFLKASTLAAGAGLTLSKMVETVIANTPSSPESPTAPGTVSLQLLDGKPLGLDSGVSFGVPWPQGSVQRNETFALTSNGQQLPLQSWPLAYWPDGSLKWSGFATVVPAGLASSLTLSAGSFRSSGSLKVTNNGNDVAVDTGALKCVIPVTGGANLIDSMTVEGRSVVGAGQLVCILQNGPQTNPEDSPSREQFLSRVKKVTVEQSGPVEQW